MPSLSTEQIKNIVKKFDTTSPNWSLIPEQFFKKESEGLGSKLNTKWHIIKTQYQITHAKKKKQTNKTRSGGNKEGYRFLVQWTNLVLLRILIRKYTSTLPKKEFRTKTQLDDAARSFVSNMEEGYKRATTKEYLNFLGYTQGSLENLGINLTKWKKWCGEHINSSKILYFPLENNKGTLKDIKGKDITFEQLIELINKSDFLLRKLVKSLEEKQERDRRDEINREIDKIQRR